MTQFKRIAVIAKPDNAGQLKSTLSRLQALLDERGLTLLPDRQSAALLGLGQGAPLSTLAQNAELAVVVGGDGTLRGARDIDTMLNMVKAAREKS